MFVAGQVSSHLLTAGVALERFFALFTPLTYQRMPHKKIATGIGLTALALSLFWFGVLAFLALLVLILYSAVMLEMRRRTKKIKPQRMVSIVLSPTHVYVLLVFVVWICIWSVFIVSAVPGASFRQPNEEEMEAKVTRTVQGLLFTYSLFWALPNILLAVLPRNAIIGPLIVLGGNLNSAVNVIIYGLKHSEFRRLGLRFLGISNKHQNSVVPATTLHVRPVKERSTCHQTTKF